MTLYDNPLSLFCRKVRLVLAYKGLVGSTVAARAWERLADGVLDAIWHDISVWT